MCIPRSDDKYRKVRDSSKKCTEIRDKFSLRQNAVRDKVQSENFFPMVRIFFFGLNFVSDCICLRLNFVSGYILQLYFVCNLLIPYCVYLCISSCNLFSEIYEYFLEIHKLFTSLSQLNFMCFDIWATKTKL